MTTLAHINAIGIASPPHDVHNKFLEYVSDGLTDKRERAVFRRMAMRSGITRRRSVLSPDPAMDRLDTEGFYRTGDFPTTLSRMARFATDAPRLAIDAVEHLVTQTGSRGLTGLTHLITVTCTGFTAPGIDLAVMARFGLPADLERTQIGFMGCNAAFNGLKLARHIVRSDPRARVLVLNVELCTLHFQPPQSLDQALMFLLFADGAAASFVTADTEGLRLDRFAQAILPDTRAEITWAIGDGGFDMYLSGDVPRHIARNLPAHLAGLLGQLALSDIDLWAVHPGGRSVLDAVEGALDLPEETLATSRAVLNDHGNMSSVTVPFILHRMMMADSRGRRGVALGFGPGLGIESLTFAEAA